MRLLAGVLVLGLAGLPAAAAAKTVEIASGAWKPYLGKDLKGGGPVARVVGEAFKSQGWSTTFQYQPWARGRKLAATGEVDATIVWSKNDKRQKTFRFAGPVLQLQTVFFHRADMDFDWSKPSDVKGLTIGGIIDYDYGPFTRGDAEQRFDIQRADSLASNFRKLVAGRVDLVPEERNVGLAKLKDMGLTGKVEMDQSTIKAADYYVMVGKNQDDTRAIVKTFEAGLAQLVDSGRYRKLLGDLKVGLVGGS